MKSFLTVNLLMLTMITAVHADDYQLRLRLAIYSTKEMVHQEAVKMITDPREFSRLKPVKIMFEQELRIGAAEEVSMELSRSAEAVNIVCSLREDDSSPVLVAIKAHYSRIDDVVDGQPLKSQINFETTLKCELGVDTPMGGMVPAGDEVVLWSVRVTKANEE